MFLIKKNRKSLLEQAKNRYHYKGCKEQVKSCYHNKSGKEQAKKTLWKQ